MPFDPQLLMAASQSPRDSLWCMTPDAIQRLTLERAQASRLTSLNMTPRRAETRDAGSVRVIRVDRAMHYDSEAWFAIPMASVIESLQAAETDDSVGAVVLSIDSPGSSAFGILDVQDAADSLATTKPLFAHNTGMCASGAYWLACSAQEIYATRRTEGGSIGTRMALYDWSKLYENEGVRPVVIDTGEFKSMGLAGTEITKTHVAHLQTQIDDLQADFIAQVEKGRKLSGESLAAVSDGRVWLAEQAVELGLFDGVQSENETIQMAAKAAAKRTTSSATKRSSAVSETATPEGPKAATLGELKKAFPESSAEFREEQIESDATLAEAAVAFANLQSADAKAAREEAEAAKAEAAEAKAAADKAGEANSATAPPKRRGNAAPSASTEQADGADTDYRAMAREYMATNKCRWSQACLAIKKRHPEAIAEFGGPPANLHGR